ncbi:MAG: murein biosynthesis integral membrane protein MurJ [Proteobacteria bacterium]|nr:murein biosynthesis integral membrane protein MurJ [Pseudomonadota bacterium]
MGKNGQEKQNTKKGMIRSIGVMSLITLFSRILGLAREVVRATLLGTSYYSDAFTLAFSLPNLFRRLTAEGIMSTAFIPVFCEVREKESEEQAFGFARNFFILLFLFLATLTLIFIFLAPWLVANIFASGFSGEPLQLTVFLTQLMFSYIILISLAAVCQGVLNSYEVFWISALTPVLMNISVIGCALMAAPYLDNPSYGFAIGVLIGGALQLFSQFPYLRKIGFRWRLKFDLKDPRMKEVGKLMAPAIFGAGIYQINIIVSNLIATTLGEGALSSLNFSNRLLELVIGVFIVSLATVLLPRISRLSVTGNFEQIREHLSQFLGLITFVTLPITVVAFVLSEEIVTILFKHGRFDQRSMLMTAGALRFHILGLLFISWNRVLLTGYQGTKNFGLTVRISAVVMVANLLLALVLSNYISHLGIALASTLSQVVQTLLLLFYLKKIRIRGVLSDVFDREIFKNILIALILWLILSGSRDFFYSQGFPVLICFLVVTFLFLVTLPLLAYLFRSSQLLQLVQLIRERKS